MWQAPSPPHSPGHVARSRATCSSTVRQWGHPGVLKQVPSPQKGELPSGYYRLTRDPGFPFSAVGNTTSYFAVRGQSIGESMLASPFQLTPSAARKLPQHSLYADRPLSQQVDASDGRCVTEYPPNANTQIRPIRTQPILAEIRLAVVRARRTLTVRIDILKEGTI